MAYIKEPKGITLLVEKRKLSLKEKKSISDFIESRKKKKNLRRKSADKTKNKSAV